MRSLLLVCAACGSSAPPLGDSDAQRPLSLADPVDAGAVDAGADAGGVAFVRQYQAMCPANRAVVWRYFDFMTKTPKDSSITLSAQSANAIGDFATTPSVTLAKVTGPDITVWTGVDVDPKLKSIGQRSLLYLRVTITLTPATDMTAPTLTDARQQYDCVQNQ